MIWRSAWISHSSVTARTTRIPIVRAKSPRWLFCHVQAKENKDAPTTAPIQFGINGKFPPTVLPTMAMLTRAYIILKSGSRGERGVYLHGFLAGGNGRGPLGRPRASRGPPRRMPTDAATYLQVGYSLRMRWVLCKTRIKLNPIARESSPMGVRNQVDATKKMAQKYPVNRTKSELPINDYHFTKVYQIGRKQKKSRTTSLSTTKVWIVVFIMTGIRWHRSMELQIKSWSICQELK